MRAGLHNKSSGELQNLPAHLRLPPAYSLLNSKTKEYLFTPLKIEMRPGDVEKHEKEIGNKEPRSP